MGRRRKQRGRPVNGILILNKPAGVTSNFALQKVKRLFGAAKAGHTGSLDPLATGVLPLCFGEATKFSQFLLDSNKRYTVKARLGVTTETGDADGQILEEQDVPHIEQATLAGVLAEFEGVIEQIPSMYSALKHNGRPLYKLAREGIEVERQPRKVELFSVDLLSFSGKELRLDVRCSKGTYIRTLIEDIGKVLGCGAHVVELDRTEAGPYTLAQSVSLEAIEALADAGVVRSDPGAPPAEECRETGGETGGEKGREPNRCEPVVQAHDAKAEAMAALDGLLLPMWSSVGDWPEVSLSDNTAYYLRQGQAVMAPKAPAAGWVRLNQDDQQFLGIGEVLDDGRIAPRRLVDVSAV